MLPILLGILILHTVWVGANLEDSYLFPDADEDNLMYVDSMEEKPLFRQDVEAKRRSYVDDSNFVRFGRSDPHVDYDPDYESDFLVRPTRSKVNNNNYNERHLRFGRSKATFLRFGRKSDPKTTFLRFGRDKYGSRVKREVYDSPQKPPTKGSSNFVRFGRNDYFMRFGREKLADRIKLPPTKPSMDNSPSRRYAPRQSVMHSEIVAQLKRFGDSGRLARLLHAIKGAKNVAGDGRVE